MIGVPGLESAYLVQSMSGPSSYDDAEIAPLLVLIKYLTAMEGVFWKEIRGFGLSYSYDIDLNIDLGLIAFSLYKSCKSLSLHRARFPLKCAQRS